MHKDTPKTIAIFTLNGVNSLLGWNAVLASLDYFQASFSDYNIYSFLPIPLFIGYLLVGSSYHLLSNKFKYVHLIITGNLTVNLSLAAIFLVSIGLDQTLIGFMALLLCAFFIGVGSNISQLTFFAMINYLSQDVVSKFTVGTALSGLLITTIRIIILAISGSNNSIYPILIFFAIAIIVNTLDMFMNIAFCKSSVYKHNIDRFLIHHDQTLLNPRQITGQLVKNMNESKELSVTASLNEDIDESETQEPLNEALVLEQERIQNQNYFITLYETLKKIAPYPYVIMFTFVITFTLFPGPSFSKSVQGLEPSWTILIMLTAYNIGDTAGKYSAEFKNIFNSKSLIFVFFSRIIFFLPITVMAMNADKDDPLINNYAFPFINQFLFAFTNGFCINASFIMAFKVCPVAYKKYAGVLCGLILQVGIIIGTILEVPYAYIIGIN